MVAVAIIYKKDILMADYQEKNSARSVAEQPRGRGPFLSLVDQRPAALQMMRLRELADENRPVAAFRARKEGARV